MGNTIYFKSKLNKRKLYLILEVKIIKKEYYDIELIS